VKVCCPYCGGALTTEPARYRCVGCGQQGERPRASRSDRIRQRALDQAFVRPGSILDIVMGMLVALEDAAARR